MVGPTKWISLVLVGLLWAGNSRIAQAQFFHGQGAPSQLAPAIDPDDTYSDDPSDDETAPQPRATARIVDPNEVSDSEDASPDEAMGAEVDENGDYIEEYEVITERYPSGAV